VRKLLRLGLIGAGPWGRNYIRTIAGLAGTQLARVASRNPQTRSLVPPGCEVSADWREVACATDVDAVVVAAPPAVHAPIVLAAIEAGRPVLVEKPLAIDVASAERLVECAARHRVLVMVDHVHLFHPAYRALRRSVSEHGPVRAIRAEAGDRGPYRSDVPVLWDWGPHDVAMCIDLLGAEPEAVDAERLERRPVGGANAERIRLVLRFQRNVAATILLSTLDEPHRRFEVRLDAQVLRYDGSAPATPGQLPLTRAVLEFAQAVEAGSASLESVRLGAAVVRTLARCDERLAAERGAA
jgi:predicted dehydrogenase